MEELIEEVRKGMLSLIGQIKQPIELYKDENILPIIYNLKKSLQTLKGFQSTNHNLTAFNNSAMELIPVVVSFLRNKSQGLDVTVDEERLRPAVKAFQADMQKLNLPPLSSSSTTTSTSSPSASSIGTSARRDDGAATSPVVSPRSATPAPSASPSSPSTMGAASPLQQRRPDDLQRRNTATNLNVNIYAANVTAIPNATPTLPPLVKPTTPLFSQTSGTFTPASPSTASSPSMAPKVLDDGGNNKKLVQDPSGPVVRGAVGVTGGSRSNLNVTVKKIAVTGGGSAPSSPQMIHSSSSPNLHGSSPAMQRSPNVPSPPQNPTVAALTVANSTPPRIGSDRPMAQPRVASPNHRPGTAGPSEPRHHTPSNNNAFQDMMIAPIPSLAMMEMPEERVAPPSPSLKQKEEAASPVDSDEEADLFSDDDEDDKWKDWDYDEDNPPELSDDEADEDFVDSMSSFEEFTARASIDGPLTLGDLQAYLNAKNPRANAANNPFITTSASPSRPIQPAQNKMQPMIAEDEEEEESAYGNRESLVEDPRGNRNVIPGYMDDEQRSGRNQIALNPTMARAGASTALVPDKELQKAKTDLSDAMRSKDQPPAGPQSTPFARVHKEGWLLKLSPNKTLGTRFQKRYFVLNGAVLAYYSGPPGPGIKSLGDVIITNATTVYRLAGPESLAKTGYLQSENAFELTVSFDGLFRTFLLVAPSMNEKKEWCDAITTAKINYQAVPVKTKGAHDMKKRGSMKAIKLAAAKPSRKISKKFNTNMQ